MSFLVRGRLFIKKFQILKNQSSHNPKMLQFLPVRGHLKNQSGHAMEYQSKKLKLKIEN
jgi:hypothetical protein